MLERADQTHEIPRTIHFIWAGGAKIMPETGLKNVMNWANSNPDFTVKIWIDRLTDPDYANKYQAAFGALGGMPANIVLADINDPQSRVASDEIRYEIDHLCPNYGASSDMLRYNILFNEGGAYFDCMDVNPGKSISLSQACLPAMGEDAGKPLFQTPLAEHHLLMHLTKHTALHGCAEAPGTEAIICTPNHPDMLRIANEARVAYHRADRWTYKKFPVSETPASPDNRSPRLIARSHSSGARRLFELRSSGSDADIVRRQESIEVQMLKMAESRGRETLLATGPNMVIGLLANGDPAKMPKKYLMPHDASGESDWVSLPKDHAGSWGALRIISCTQADAMTKALKSIEFERNHMNFTNIPLHVEQVVTSVIQYAKANNQPAPNVSDLRVSIKRELEERLLARPSRDHSP